MTAAGKSSDRGPGAPERAPGRPGRRGGFRGLVPQVSGTVRRPVEITDPISHEEIDLILAGQHHDPHAVLGAHLGPRGTVIRALRPLAWSVDVVLPDGSRYPMGHVHEGVFSVTVPADAPVGEYRLAVSYRADGPELLADDPYRHLPTLGEMDLHLIGEGRHEELWRVLGARVRPELRRCFVRRLGAERTRGSRHRGLQPLGRPGAPDALARQLWRLGAVRSRRRIRRQVQVRDLRPGRGMAPQGRPAGCARRGAASDRVSRIRLRLRVGRQGLDDGQGRARSAARADEHLRSSPRLMAARPFLCGVGRGPR